MDITKSLTRGLGLENRSAILPSPNIPDKTPGIFGPDYSFADNVPLPGQVGIREGDSISSVIDSVKGAAYYVDLIGFGKSSSSFTQGVGPGGQGPKRLGVNTWMKTGFQCSNGADMHMYVEGIPKGDALGKTLAKGLESANLPPMQGLAPGILEDVKDALDPAPIMSAVFGTGFPICRLEERQVGDQDGRIRNKDTGAFYVENPDTVRCTGGGVPVGAEGKCARGVPVQRRWVKAGDLSYDQYKNAPKTHCPNGYMKTSHRDQDCMKELVSRKFEGFQSAKEDKAVELFKMIGAAAGALLFVGVAFKLARDP